MNQQTALLRYLFVVLFCVVTAGCTESPTTSSKPQANGDEAANGGAASETVEQADSGDTNLSEYPDVPRIPVMTDVDGIEIPRFATQAQDIQITGEIPADVGNEYAQQHPSPPVTGGEFIIRFNSEPKTLNPIVETSAVQTYIFETVNDALARQNPETLEFEPHIANRWVAEDSVKLSPDYPLQERRLSLADGEPQAELTVTYEQTGADTNKPPVLEFQTTDVNGNALGGVWVGLFPAETILGAPTTGYHQWSNDEGVVQVSAIVPGKYHARVGAEIFGETTEHDDGSLTVTPSSPGNPLLEEFPSAENVSLTLARDEWIDVQRQTIYTYFLREDVEWSDGSPFSAKDLEFAYAVINSPFVDGESLRVYYADVISCDALDAHTVRMRYRQQYFKSFEFTAGLAFYAPPWHLFWQFFSEQGKTLTLETLTPEEEVAQNKVSVHGQTFGKFYNTDERYNLKPLGTGPYVVDTWVRADRVEVVRNPDYWGDDQRGYLDRIVFKFIPDNVTALQALKAGEIDFLYRMDSEQYFEDLGEPPSWFSEKYVKAAWYSPGFSYVGWNMLKPMFQDRRVRIALTLLFNRQEFVEKKLHGEAVLVSGSQYIFGPAYDHTVPPIGYDPETAQDLLAEAGWVDTDNDGVLDKGGQRFEFTYLFPPGNPVNADRAALIQRSYKQAGIQINIRSFEWASFIDKIKSRDFDVVSLGWASPVESDPFQIWHGSQAGADKRGSNHVSFNNPEADALIEKARVTLDAEKRHQIFHSFHRILDREQPYMFLYTPKDFGAYHKRLQGVKWYRIRPGFDLREWYVPKELQLQKEEA